MNRSLHAVLYAVLSLAYLFGQAHSVAAQPAKAQAAADYNDLAAVVGEPIFDETNVKKARDAYTDGAVMTLKEYQRQRLNDLRRLDATVEAAREKIAKPLWECNRTYKEIRRLDDKTPDYEGIAKRAISAAPGLMKEQKDRKTSEQDAIDALIVKAIWEAGVALYNAYELSNERENYQKHYGTSRTTTKQAMVELVRKRYSEVKPSASANKPIAIAYVNPSLANTYINDFIAVRNDSGKDLTACTLFVGLGGIRATTGDAESDGHFHYVSSWPAGEYRYVWYPARAARGIATNESVDVIRKVEIDFFCDQFVTTATFDFAGKRYDEYVKKWAEEHLKPESFSGRWYADADNLIDPAGFEVTYKGTFPKFTVQRVTVEAVHGERSEWVYDAGTSWATAQKKWICHKNFNPLNPGKVNVIITFPGSSYEHVITWNR